MKRLLTISLVLMFNVSVWANESDTMNFRFAPAGVIIGALGATMDFKIAPSWTLGPELKYWHLDVGSNADYSNSFHVNAFSGGARANWFKNGAFTSGLYVGPHIAYASADLSTSDTQGKSVTASQSAVQVGCLVGYAWFWNSFNMMLGGGGNLLLGSTHIDVTDTDGTTTSVNNPLGGLDFEFTLGWTF